MAGKPPLPVRLLGALLSGALIVVSPGPSAWAAAGRIAPISVNTPIGGTSGSAASAAARGSGQSNLSAGAAATGGSLTGSLAPSIGSPELGAAPAFTLPVGLPGADLTPSVMPPAPSGSAPRALNTPQGAAVEAVPAQSEPQGFESGLEPASHFKQGVGRVKSGFTALKSLFTSRRDVALSVRDSAEGGLIQGSGNPLKSPESKLGSSPANAPNSDVLKPSDDQGPPPVPPSEGDKKTSDGKKWFGLGAVVAGLIGGMLVMQLGLEAQGAAMAQLTEKAFGDFSILAQVAIFASLGSMIGQQVAQSFSAKFGLTKTFYAAHTLRALSLGAMVFLLGTGMIPLPLMFAFYAFNGVVTGVALNAEGTLRKFILAQQGVSQQKFRTWWQLLAEIVAVPAPMVLGALVPMLGASLITGLYPATILIGLMLFFMFKIIPFSSAQRIEARFAQAAPAQAPASEPGAPKASAWQRVKDAFKRVFANMEEGKDLVLNTPLLKYSLFGALIFDLLNLIIYRLIAPGYGKMVAGSTEMAAVQGNIVGMFSLGGLLLAATFLLLEKRAAKRDQGQSEAQRAAHERGSMLRWMMLGVPALALLGVMAFKLALPFAPVIFLGVNWVPATALAAALIPFGFFQVAASIKLNSYFNDKLPEDPVKVQKAIAFSGSAMTAMSILLMLALKPLFGDLAAFDPFPWLAAAVVPVGAALFYLQRKLSTATKPENMASPETATKGGGYVGLVLGVLSAALVLTALPFIPGLAGLVTGLGVLGKFILHLSVALALPIAGYFADRALRRR